MECFLCFTLQRSKTAGTERGMFIGCRHELGRLPIPKSTRVFVGIKQACVCMQDKADEITLADGQRTAIFFDLVLGGEITQRNQAGDVGIWSNKKHRS